MALDDIVNDEEDEVKNEQLNELKSELGVEDVDDLQEAKDRMQFQAQVIVNLAKEVEDIEDKLEKHEKMMELILQNQDA